METKAMQTTLQQMAVTEQILNEMRVEFSTATDPRHIARLASEISIAAAKLDALKNLYRILGGK